MMWIGVLGQLAVELDGVPIPIRASKLRILLAALLAQPNRVVSYTSLAEALWESEPPATAQVTVRNYVSRLREALGPEGGQRIVTHAPGYRIEVSDSEYDLFVFERLCRRGRVAARAARWHEAAECFDEALELWRGEPLSDVPSHSLRVALVPHLSELRLQAVEARCMARLQLGAGAELIADLRRLTAEHPLRERFHSQLMLALARGGRQAEALSVYQAAHRRLIKELGVEPGPELREMHARILNGDVDLLASSASGTHLAADETDHAAARPPLTQWADASDTSQSGNPQSAGPQSGSEEPADDMSAPAASPAPHDGAVVPARPTSRPASIPRQLPNAPRYFTGRSEALKILDELMLPADGEDEPDDCHQRSADELAGPLTVVTGTAGIGKTALALHWSRRAEDRFPDGQLYVNLRGFDPAGRPVQPAEAIAAFLDAFGVAASAAPSGLSAQAALYRSLLAQRRVLVVLDNANDADQIRPLLPGSAGCAVLVTSRDRMAGLAATDGAHLLNLDVLDETESRELLHTRLRAERIVADPAAVDSLAGLCAGLPLALSIVAAHAALRAHLPLAALAADLGAARSRLDGLDLGDSAADVRAAISWSYRSLSAPAARMFRLLGVHPGPDISAAAAASLAGVLPNEARAALGELIRVNLLAEHVPHRYALHDLLRAYALEQVAAVEPDGGTQARAALRRVLDHYLRTGEAAATLVDPARDRLPLPPMSPGVTLEDTGDADGARRWFEAEHRVLVVAVGVARGEGFLEHAWQIPAMMNVFLDRCGHWHSWAASAETALDAAHDLGNTEAQVRMHRNLAVANSSLGLYDQARLHYTRSLLLSRRIDDFASQGHAHRGLAQIAELQGRDHMALEHGRRALALFIRADHRPGKAHALNDTGWSYAKLGDNESGIEYCERALSLLRELGDEDGEAAALDSLGYIHRRLGEHAASADCYRRALAVYQRIGDRYREARTLMRLSEDEGIDPATAQGYNNWALTILSEIGRAPDSAADAA